MSFRTNRVVSSCVQLCPLSVRPRGVLGEETRRLCDCSLGFVLQQPGEEAMDKFHPHPQFRSESIVNMNASLYVFRWSVKDVTFPPATLTRKFGPGQSFAQGLTWLNL